MKALWFNGRNLELREIRKPRPTKNEALVKVHFVGICNTDLEILKGYMGFVGVPGHEFVGIVEQGPSRWLGKRVVGEINLACGKCGYCGRGLAKHCPNRKVLGIARKNGAFAEYITLPIQNLHEVPDSVSDKEAVFVEPLAAALRILDQVKINKKQKIFVLGDGKLGQLIARVVKLKTRNLMLVGKHPEKLALAMHLGIKTALAGNLRLKPEDKPELVIEATGSPEGFNQAIGLCRPQGTVVLKSTFNQNPGLNLSQIVVDEITIIGSRCGDFQKALKALKSGKINLDRMITGVYALEKFRGAFAKARSSHTLKVLIKCLI
jgi:2-desacetyl-2-hydroxyethyl bacteriochlorophyllide A dehydrogenase